MTIRRLLICFFLSTTTFFSFAGIHFDNLDLNAKNELIFTAEHKVAGSFSYNSVLRTKIESAKKIQNPEILTCFPERMELIADNSTLQIRNRYGMALYSFASSSLVYLDKEDELPLYAARPIPISVSPNGKWQCYVKSEKGVRGKLFLQNTTTRESFVLNENAEFSYENVPVKWSPDSSTVLYEKDGSVCFANPDAINRNVQIDERFRALGKGTINSVYFTRTQQLIFINGDIVYCLNVSELYTLGLYSSYIGSGTSVARLPVTFNPDKDCFYVSDDASRLVMIQNHRIVSLYEIQRNKFSYVNVLYSMPFISNSANVSSMTVIWPEGTDTKPILQVKLLALETNSVSYKLYQITNSLNEVLTVLSPASYATNKSETKVAYYSGNALHIYDTKSWKRIAVFPCEKTVCLIWNGEDILITGGTEVVRAWNVAAETFKTLFLASAKSLLWNEKTGAVQAQSSSGAVYRYDEKKHVWATDTNYQFNRKNIVQNGYFRVYTGASKNQKYENALYVRDLSTKAFTWSLYADMQETKSAQKKVSLVFDALDCSEGLAQILAVLKENNIPSTFFINGEFIKRYPQETKQIALSGFDCASLFYTNADLTGKGFLVDEDFIRRGLARNEDDFYQCTGKELSLLWHAPYYKTTSAIIQAGIKAGYSYVSALGGYRDGITLEDHSQTYKTASQLIEDYLNILAEGKPTVAVIPVSVGVSGGTRSDYLYEKLDLLINLLLDSGYEIVPLGK